MSSRAKHREPHCSVTLLSWEWARPFWYLRPNLSTQAVQTALCPLTFGTFPDLSISLLSSSLFDSCLPRDLEQWLTAIEVWQFSLTMIHNLFPQLGACRSAHSNYQVWEIWSVISSLSILPVHPYLEGIFLSRFCDQYCWSGYIPYFINPWRKPTSVRDTMDIADYKTYRNTALCQERVENEQMRLTMYAASQNSKAVGNAGWSVNGCSKMSPNW